MKFISWNVNGLRACAQKGFFDFMKQEDADFFCIQETKMQREQSQFEFPGLEEYWNSAVKKGYSGTAVFAKTKPLSVGYGLDIEIHDQEGRIITLEYENFYLVNVYTPNAQHELARLPYRMEWEEAFRLHLTALDQKKPVIVCGDLNVAHQEIDLKNPKSNRNNPGFTDAEREKMTQLLQAGFTDSFRYVYPQKTDAYTWWSYRFKAREKNVGWRIDYFLVSKRLEDKITEACIYAQTEGSDHCPVGLVLNNSVLRE